MCQAVKVNSLVPWEKMFHWKKPNQAARDTVIILFAIVKKDILDLDRIKGVVNVHGFIRSASGFDQQPLVLDGATELLIEIFGENGKLHVQQLGSRTILSALQFNLIWYLK